MGLISFVAIFSDVSWGRSISLLRYVSINLSAAWPRELKRPWLRSEIAFIQ